MRRNYIILFLLSCTFSCLAAPIDKKKALKIAEDFYKQQIQEKTNNSRQRSITQANFQLDYICKDDSKENKRVKSKNRTTEEPPNLYYIFNADKEQGFVIVSGDDRAGEVLAYSTKGRFSHNDMPENLKVWMEDYKNAIRSISKNDRKDKFSANRESIDPFRRKVLPLLEKEGISWGQRAPFNDNCPIDKNGKKSLTGCVATAMSQMMRYHKHPQKGEGQKRYKPQRLEEEITVDFSNGTYDWNKMLPKYNRDGYNATEAKEIAKLMYHAGVSVKMNYSSKESSAHSSSIKDALVEHFGYDKSMDYLEKKLYNHDEWVSIIKKELTEKRPVIFSGSSIKNISSGHAFVCDGYDSGNLFHINWGWSGLSDGYFDLSILDPDVHGDGGGEGGYNKNQSILIGIQPKLKNSPSEDNDSSDSSPMLSFWNVFTTRKSDKQHTDTLKRNEDFHLSYSISNDSKSDFEGDILVVLKNQHSEHTIATEKSMTLVSKGFSNRNFTLNIDDSTPNGEYKLFLKLKYSNSNKEMNAVLIDKILNEGIDVKITDTNIEFNYKTTIPKLEIIKTEVKSDIKNDYLFKNRIGEIAITVKNSGNAPYNSDLRVFLSKKSDGENIDFDYDHFIVEPNENKTLILKNIVPFEPGDYNIGIKYYTPQKGKKRDINTISIFINSPSESISTIIDTNKTVKVMPEPDGSKLVFDNFTRDLDTARGDKLKISFTLRNEGESFSDYLEIELFKPVERYEDYYPFQTEKRLIKINKGEKKTIDFEINTEHLKESKALAEDINLGQPVPYMIMIKYKSKTIEFGGENKFMFYINTSKNALLSCTPTSLDEVMITNKVLSLDLPIRNSGAKFENKAIRIDFLDEQDNIKSTIENTYTIDKDLTLSLKDNDATCALFPGTYTIDMFYQNSENKFIPLKGKYGYLEIKIGESKLEIDNSSPQDELKFKLTENFTYTVKINNKGGALEKGSLYLEIVPSEKLAKDGQLKNIIPFNAVVPRKNLNEIVLTTKLDENTYRAGNYTIQLKQKTKTAVGSRARNNQEMFITIGEPKQLTILTKDGKTVGLLSNETDKPRLRVQQCADNLMIELPKKSETVYIYDMTGRLHCKNKLSAEQTEFIYQTSKLNTGIYLVAAEGVYGKIIEKVYVK